MSDKMVNTMAFSYPLIVLILTPNTCTVLVSRTTLIFLFG